MTRTRQAVLAGISMLAMAGAAYAAPAITLVPAVGPPTTKITVKATGFPFSTAVDLFFDTTDMCLTITDGTGAASCVIAVPRDAQPQSHWITGLVHGGATGAQKAFTVRTDMPQFHGRNAMHQGINPFENTIDAGNVGSLDILWQQPVGKGCYGCAPVVANGYVYTVTSDGQLFAFNAGTGAPLSGFPRPIGAGATWSSPAVGGGNVYAVTTDAQLFAFNAFTGATISGFPVPLHAAAYSSPALALGNVYVVTQDSVPSSQIYAFNAATGVPVPGFSAPLGGFAGLSSPTVAYGNVYIGTISDNRLYGFNALTGASLARFPYPAGSWIYSTAAAAHGALYFAADDARLYALNALTGVASSGFPATIPTPTNSSPAVAGGQIFVGAGSGSLHSFRSNDGHQNFAVQLTPTDGLNGSPVVANNIVYVASTNRLHAVSTQGVPLWSAAVANSSGDNSPVIANGIVYFTDSVGYLTAYSVNGIAPSARLPGGALGVKPALSALQPDTALKPNQPRAVPVPPDAEE